MLIKRVGTVLIVSALVCGGISCGKNDTESESPVQNMYVQTSVAETEPPVFADQDFGGSNVVFLTYNEHASSYVDSYIIGDLENGDIISKAVNERNTDTENKFNVNILTDPVYSPKNEAINRLHAGQCDFDVIYEWGTESSALALDGLLYNFSELNGVDLNRSYWVPTAKNDLEISGKTYIAASFISLNSLNYADMLYFNKSMYKDIGYTDSLYDSVFSGMWTTDKLVEIAVSATKDVDGDGEMMAADRYGFWGSVDDCLTGLAESAGVQNTVKNSNGSYSLDVYNKKIIDIYTSYANVLQEQDHFITYEDIWQERPDLTDFPNRKVGARFMGFGKGNVMFMPGTLSMVREFENMSDDFGILPYPLYDAEQRNYCHFIDCNAPMISIPGECDNIDNIGLILEYMSYSSEQKLLPAFLKDVTESAKTSGDDNARVIGIIKNSLRYEWTELYNLEVASAIKNKMMASGSFKSVYERLYSKAVSEINGCIDTLTFLGME